MAKNKKSVDLDDLLSKGSGSGKTNEIHKAMQDAEQEIINKTSKSVSENKKIKEERGNEKNEVNQTNIESKRNKDKDNDKDLDSNEKTLSENVTDDKVINKKIENKEFNEISADKVIQMYNNFNEEFYKAAVMENPNFKDMIRDSTIVFRPVKESIIEAAQVHGIRIEHLVNNILVDWLIRNQEYITKEKNKKRSEMKNIIEGLSNDIH